MTASHLRVALAGAIASAVVAGVAGAAHHEEEGHPAEDVVEVVSTNVGGKNVFIPSTIVVKAGQPAVLSIFNTTDTPHGFRIEEAQLEVVLPVQEEHRVELPALRKGIYKIRCHLHPPHRSATLLVVDAGAE